MQLLARDSIRILHVDDDDDFAELSARGLQRAGFRQPVTRCHDGLRALNYCSLVDQETAPHIILLDLHMPGMNGLEVLRWLRQNYSERNVAVYLLTSSEDPAHKKQAAAHGVTEYLLKSSAAECLIEKIDLLIAKINTQLGTKTSDQKGNSDSSNQGLTRFPQAISSPADRSSYKSMG